MGVMTLPSLALIRREFVANLRRPRAIFWLTLLFGACMMVLVVGWPAGRLQPNMAGRRFDAMFQGLMFVLFGGCLLCVPAIASGSVVSEKQQETLDMLRLTLVRPTGVILAKLFNTVGVFLLLLAGLTPLVAVLISGIGLDWLQLLLALVQILATAVTCACLGILCSAFFRRAIWAASGSYVAVAALMWLAPLLIGMAALVLAAFELDIGDEEYLWPLLNMTSPGVMIGSLVLRFATVEWWQVVGHFVFLGGVSSISLLGAHRYLYRHGQRHVPETEKPIDDPAVLSARRRKFPYYLLDPLKRKKPIEDGRNPLLVRELRWGIFSRSAVFVRLFYCTFPIFGFMTIWLLGFNVPDAEAIVGAAVLQMVVLVAVAPALLANSFTKEYELGNIDMLRMTLLSPRAVVHGKAGAGLMAQCPVLLAAVFCSLVTVVFAPRFWLPLAAGLATLLVCAFISTSLGLFASLLTRRTTVSLILGYGLAFIAFWGIYGAAAGVDLYRESAWGSSASSIAVAERAPIETALFSPIIAYAASFHRAGFELTMVRVWGVSVLASTALAFGMLQVASFVFGRFRMQDP
jgi:hypothetical protein